MTQARKRRYFVCTLDKDDYRPVPEAVYEIQFLNDDEMASILSVLIVLCECFAEDVTLNQKQ